MLLVPPAVAETAEVLPHHSAVTYVGGGATTYAHVNTGPVGGVAAERAVAAAVQARLDLYGAWSPLDRLQLSVYVPPTASFAAGSGETFVTVGQTALQGRFALARGRVPVTLALGVASQAWNWEERSRYTMVGEATTDVLPGLYVGATGTLGAWTVGATAFGTYAWRFPAGDQPEVERKAPMDDVRGGMEVRAGRELLSVQVGAYTLQRLGGTSFYALRGSPDVWAAVDYDIVSVGAKVSLALPHDNGLHLAVNRAVWVHNGPVDATDLSLGWHHYFAPGAPSCPSAGCPPPEASASSRSSTTR